MRYPCLTPYNFLWHVGHACAICPYPQRLIEGFFLSFLHEFRDCTYNMEAKCFGKCCVTEGKLRCMPVYPRQEQVLIWGKTIPVNMPCGACKRRLDKHQEKVSESNIFLWEKWLDVLTIFLLSPVRYINWGLGPSFILIVCNSLHWELTRWQ